MSILKFSNTKYQLKVFKYFTTLCAAGLKHCFRRQTIAK